MKLLVGLLCLGISLAFGPQAKTCPEATEIATACEKIEDLKIGCKKLPTLMQAASSLYSAALQLGSYPPPPPEGNKSEYIQYIQDACKWIRQQAKAWTGLCLTLETVLEIVQLVEGQLEGCPQQHAA